MASELKVDTIKHTNNTSAITLDTSGNVTLAGSANNLGTVSAGTIGSSVSVPDQAGSWKLLNRTAISGSPTQIEFINGTGGVVIDSSTYEMYQFRISGIGCATDIVNVSLQVGSSSGYLTTGVYRLAGTDRNSNGDISNRAFGNFKHMPLSLVGTSNATAERFYLSTVDMSLKPSHYATIQYITSLFQDNSHYSNHHGGGSPIDSSYYGDDIDRIKFFWHGNYSTQNTGTFRTWQNEGSIALYGLKTS